MKDHIDDCPNQNNYGQACECGYKPKFVSIIITRRLAQEFAYNWLPCEDDDPIQEMIDVCRRAVEQS
jgi:hypothetical protein